MLIMREFRYCSKLDNFKVIHEISIAWNLDYDRPSFSAKSVARIKKKKKKSGRK